MTLIFISHCSLLIVIKLVLCDTVSILNDFMKSLSVIDVIGGVMVSVFTSRVVDRGFESRSGQTKDCKIGICCFSTKQATLRRKSKDWLARNQDNVSGVERHAYPRIVVSVS